MARKAATVSCVVWVMRHPACVRVVRRNRHADVLHRHDREPVAWQILRVREPMPAHPRRRRNVSEPRRLCSGYSSSAGACSCFP